MGPSGALGTVSKRLSVDSPPRSLYEPGVVAAVMATGTRTNGRFLGSSDGVGGGGGGRHLSVVTL